MVFSEKVVTELYPSLREAGDIISNGLTRGDLIIVFGRCQVDYEGRAASDLGIGERLILIKPDGVVAVHADEKVQPKNWQPSGSSCKLDVSDEVLTVTAVRSSPKETLDIMFSSVLQVSSYDVEDPEDLAKVGTEEQMQRRIMENPEIIEDGFEAIEAERSLSVGSVDIFGRDSDGTPVILELKRRRTGPESVDQLKRYVKTYSEEIGESVRGIIVAPSLTDSAKRFLERSGLELIQLEPRLDVEQEEDATLEEFTN